MIVQPWRNAAIAKGVSASQVDRTDHDLITDRTT